MKTIILLGMLSIFLLTNAYSQITDSSFYDKKTKFLYQSSDVIGIIIPRKNRLYTTHGYSLGYCSYIKPRFALRAEGSIGFFREIDPISPREEIYAINLGYQYQIGNIQHSPIHIGQYIGGAYIEKEGEIRKSVGSGIWLGFTSPLYKKYPKWHIGAELGYNFYYDEQTQKVHLQASPIVFMIQYYFRKYTYYKNKTKQDEK